jgi:predicted CXXCH cytochrome family protein
MKQAIKKRVAAMQTIRIQLQLAVFLGGLSSLAQAAVNCDVESNVVPYTNDIGPRHHPIGRSLPQTASFNQPIACDDGNWFFDLNHNGRPDPAEPRLYGPLRVTACSSCHAESTGLQTATAASVFLRQDVKVLCLVCHRL